MAQREMCKVGDSPTNRQRSLSPRRGSGGKTTPPEDNPEETCKVASPEGLRSPSKVVGERRISTRLKGEEAKGAKSPKHAAWKSSKFFSRSMASGELLKGFGLKKPVPPTDPPAEAVKEDSSKSSFKSRFSSLRRKSGSDSDSVPNVDSETLKHGSPDVRGIVCKKEDLLHLIAKGGPKGERRVSSPSELVVPAASSLPTSPVPVLKSPSIRVAPPLKVTPSFRSQQRSASLDPTALPSSSLAPPRGAGPSIRLHPADDIGLMRKTGSLLEVVPEVKRRLSGPLIELKERIVEEDEDEEAVQWDEANFVDPNLLGGAIEAFLKGMGTSPSPTPTTEKRVSFKKNLIK